MKKLQKLVSAVLSCALALSLAAAPALAAEGVQAGMDNFQVTQTYASGQFADVSDGAWYAQSVKTAYELGLVQGVSDTAFNPGAPITVGSAITLAARIHSIYTTGSADTALADAPAGSPWYQGYVNYAVANGIIASGQFADYDANATRRQFAGILAKALPAEALEAVNTVEDGAIPDVVAGSLNYNEIYTLYRAGILTGNDAAGTFAPETTIDRASVAAIVSRMADPELRQSITLTAPVVPVTPVAVTAVTLSQTSLSLTTGGTATLTATVSPADAANKTLSWTSSNTGVATVNNGTVTAVAAGTTTITAMASNGVHAQCTVTITAPAPVQPTVASYPGFPGVPDFGAVLGISALVDTSDSGEEYVGWFYTSNAIDGSGHGEDFAELYGNALTSSGFTYLTDFETDDGGTNLVFTNGTYSVVWGATVISGIVGIMVMVTPA